VSYASFITHIIGINAMYCLALDQSTECVPTSKGSSAAEYGRHDEEAYDGCNAEGDGGAVTGLRRISHGNRAQWSI